MSLPDIKETEVGRIGNYYGCLSIKRENGVCYWSIENWDGHGWEPISHELFDLIEKEQTREGDL